MSAKFEFSDNDHVLPTSKYIIMPLSAGGSDRYFCHSQVGSSLYASRRHRCPVPIIRRPMRFPSSSANAPAARMLQPVVCTGHRAPSLRSCFREQKTIVDGPRSSASAAESDPTFPWPAFLRFRMMSFARRPPELPDSISRSGRDTGSAGSAIRNLPAVEAIDIPIIDIEHE